jgi:catechol 2,3-dioxygenase-like lactoylglutathione lyase family enzyme
MNNRSAGHGESAVQFATESRMHMGLAVKDLQKSMAFYRGLLGQEPTKVRPRYAKYEVAEPPVNLALNEVGGATGQNNIVAHFGIQVKSTEAVRTFADRLTAAGIAVDLEEQVTCCYAVQNKVWATDPDGNKWEVYVLLDDHGAQHASSAGECCSSAEGCCGEEAVITEAAGRSEGRAGAATVCCSPTQAT